MKSRFIFWCTIILTSFSSMLLWDNAQAQNFSSSTPQMCTNDPDFYLELFAGGGGLTQNVTWEPVSSNTAIGTITIDESLGRYRARVSVTQANPPAQLKVRVNYERRVNAYWVSNSYDFSIPIVPPPFVNFNSSITGPSWVGTGVPTPYMADINQSGSIASYRWLVDGISVTETTSRSVAITFLTPGSHTLTCAPLNMCGQSSRTFDRVVDVCTSVKIDAPMYICPGEEIMLTAQSSGPAQSYSWTKDGMPIDNVTTQQLKVTLPGIYAVTARFSSVCVARASKTIVASAAPASPITAVHGLDANFSGGPTRLKVVGAEDATAFTWKIVTPNVTEDFRDAGGAFRNVLFTPPTAGAYELNVTPVINTCEGTPEPFSFTALSQAVMKQDTVFMRHSDLVARSTGYLYLPKHSPDHNGCLSEYGPVTVYVNLDLGRYYNLGKHVFTGEVKLRITAYADIPGEHETWEFPLKVTQEAPEQLFKRKISVNSGLVRYIKIEVTGYTDPGVVAASQIRLRAFYEEQDIVDVQNIKLLNLQAAQEAGIRRWEQTFTWETPCTDVLNYVFQMFKQYGETPNLDLEDTWTDALQIETEDSDPSLTLSMAEGTGLYHWRVIPLGNKPGGIANPANWPAPPYATATLDYHHPEEQKNWIYSRTFTEGNKVTEQIAYANGLNQGAQQQTRIQGINKVVALQTIADYSGRTVITTLPVPLAGEGQLGYVPKLLQKNTGGALYQASDFDGLATPAPAKDVSGYYSGEPAAAVDNDRVASAGGYPFSQVVYVPDGTGRVAEEAGVGAANSKAGKKTRRINYDRPTEAELVAMFGIEAPEVSGVVKVITYDNNDIANVTFQTKDGKVVATALTLTGTTGPFAQLNPAPKNITFVENVQNNKRLDKSTLVSSTLMFVPGNSTVKVDYKLAPGMVQELCQEIQQLGTFCMTCDYTVKFRLVETGTNTSTEPLAPVKIRAGLCSELANRVYDPAEFNLSLEGGKNYVLEKYLALDNKTKFTPTQTYLDSALAVIEQNYRARMDARLTEINRLMDAGNVQELYAYLATIGTLDEEAKQYIVSLQAESVNGCQQLIMIPWREPCPDEGTVNSSTCKLEQNGVAKSFERYFEDYYAGRTDIRLRTNSGDSLRYLWFANQYPLATVKEKYFLPGEFNTMVANMIADNPQLGNRACEIVWEAWKMETAAYEAKLKAPRPVAPVGSVYPAFDSRVNILQSFLTNVEAQMQSVLVEEQGSADLCTGVGRPLFIRRETLYGKVAGVETTEASDRSTTNALNPNMTIAYRLVYYNSDVEKMKTVFQFYAGIRDKAVQPLVTHFLSNAMGDCDRYYFSRVTSAGEEVFDIPTDGEVINGNVSEIRDICEHNCEKRSEEFRQAVINALLSNDANTRIEHYRVYQAPFFNPQKMRTYMGIFDISVNATDYNVSICDLDAMTKALVDNCKNNYCPVLKPRTVQNPNTTDDLLVYGTAADYAKIEKALLYNFDLKINATGQSCNAGWDRIDPSKPAGVSTNSFSSFHYGDVFAGNPARSTYDKVFVVTTNKDSGAGSLREAITMATTYSAQNPTHYSLIKFSISGQPLPIRIELKSYLWVQGSRITIDGTTQSGFDAANGPAIKIYPKYSSPGTDAIRVAGNYNEVRGIHFHAQDPSSFRVECSGGKLIGNIFTKVDTQFGDDLVYVNRKSEMAVVRGNIFGTDISLRPVTYLDGAALSVSGGVIVGGPNQGDGNAFTASIGVSITFDQADTSTPTAIVSNNFFAANQPVIVGTLGSVSADVLVSKNLTNYQYSAGPVELVRHIVVTPGGQTLLAKPQVTSFGSMAGSAVASGTAVPGSTLELFLVESTGGFSDPNVLKYLGTVSVTSNGAWTFSSQNVAPGQRIGAVASKTGSISSSLGVSRQLPGTTCVTPRTICFAFTNRGMDGFDPDKSIIYNPEILSCEKATMANIREAVGRQVEQSIAVRREFFREQYYNTCGNPALINDNLTITKTEGLYHFTLYYYDRAGNLIKTVPPEGVRLLDVSTIPLLDAARLKDTEHEMVTEYQYNSLGQPIREHTPDGHYGYDYAAGTMLPGFTKPVAQDEQSLNASRYYSSSIYTDKGQIRFSQSAQQKVEGKYSYTKYDALGRVLEVGEGENFDDKKAHATRNETGLETSFPYTGGKSANRTVYNEPFPLKALPCGTTSYPDNVLPCGYVQVENNLRNRVSYTYQERTSEDGQPIDRVYTVYNYDAHGNVDWFVQIIPGLPAVGVRYTYDLLSNKVTEMQYNPGKRDQFFHRYAYDANDRLEKVLTSRDGQLWETDAWYTYYLHGPVKRMALGEDLVQGVDYTYTIAGWLKGINHGLLNISSDPGKDGATGGASNVARDAFGMALGFHADDYFYQGSPFVGTASGSGNQVPLAGKNLYNGNISSWSMNMLYPSASGVQYGGLTGSYYSYDVLNRLIGSRDQYYNSGVFTDMPSSYFVTAYGYDGNGNLTTANHNSGNTTNPILDRLAYSYVPGTNRLDRVTEGAEQPTSFDGDIEKGQGTSNYQYDADGNLVRDVQQDVKTYWNIQSKVDRVETVRGVTRFSYDASGNRVLKQRVNKEGLSATNYYVRDGQGNVLTIYEKTEELGTTGDILRSEVPLYGAGKLGSYIRPVSLGASGGAGTPTELNELRILESTTKDRYESLSYLLNPEVELTLGPGFAYASTGEDVKFGVRTGAGGEAVAAESNVYTRRLSSRKYELTDHLGNIRALVTDTKLSTITATVADNFTPEVVSVQNYYPFGMEVPGRSWNAGTKYRYGFNGKEKDSDGEFGNTHYDYGFRIYNPGLGRFLSVDPLTGAYAELTPYQFASNRPIDGIDIDGLEYGTYRIVLNREMNIIVESEYIPYNAQQLNAHGPKGRGIVYNINGKETWYPRNKTLVGTFPTEYGNYYGETGFFKLNKDGKFTSVYDYSIPAVDAVDYGARTHDQQYDLIKAVGPASFKADWGTIPADITAMETWSKVVELGVGGIDPVTKQPITKDEVDAASGGIYVFGISVTGKKSAISEWMYKHYPKVSRNPHAVNDFWEAQAALPFGTNWKSREYNYQQFIKMYMEKTDEGMIRKEGMWKKDRDIYVPIVK
ncbi:hypothetical protein KK062_16515 [Fulvivirgaceae bacterium PWU5]|uniref:Uncharacterized protein n=1 Tax=Dawidia cretensis TaxID=2782350 RepID=A0AAP2DY90_9BACT|nr:RHS repeat-associated core domain-containing protein [Dawidia cretensis]MBT1709850.1 hypothetical protein [Dawidia cretensis]